MSTHQMTAEEFFDSITGFDEMAIKKAFGRPVVKLAEEDQIEFARALIFVAQRRAGESDTQAKDSALNMTLGEVNRYFADEEPEAMPEEPTSEPGKGV